MREAVTPAAGQAPAEENRSTTEGFYRGLERRMLLGSRCRKCGALYVPPTPLCTKCFGRDTADESLSGAGSLVTFTVVHVASPEFQHLAPYAVAVVRLREGPFVLGMLRGVKNPDEIRLEAEVFVDFESSVSLTPGKTRLVFKLESGS